MHEPSKEGRIAMRMVHISARPEEPMGEAIPMAGWTRGPVTRTRQPIIPEAGIVNFKKRHSTHAH